MITVIHGDNNLQIQKEVQNLKDKFGKADIIIMQKPDALAVRQQLGSSAMFFDDRVTFIEGLLEKGVTQEFVDFLKTLDRETQVIFVANVRLDRESSGISRGKKKAATDLLKGKKLLDALQKEVFGVRVIACNDYSLFDFLDSLVPKNGKAVIISYDKLLTNGYEAEQIFYMITDQFRNLIIAKDLGADGLSGMHEFRRSKFVSQAHQFTMPQLIKIYEQFFALELAQKQKRIGEGSPFPMKDDLRFLLANLFN